MQIERIYKDNSKLLLLTILTLCSSYKVDSACFFLQVLKMASNHRKT